MRVWGVPFYPGRRSVLDSIGPCGRGAWLTGWNNSLHFTPLDKCRLGLIKSLMLVMAHICCNWEVSLFIGPVGPAVNPPNHLSLEFPSTERRVDWLEVENVVVTTEIQSFVRGFVHGANQREGGKRCNSLVCKYGGPGTRTPMCSRTAVFKTAALPVRSSPPECVT